MSRIFFMDGKFIPEEEAVIPVTTHAKVEKFSGWLTKVSPIK